MFSQQNPSRSTEHCDLLVDHPLNTVETHLEDLPPRTVRETHEMMARAVEQITSARRVEIEENARHDDNLFFETGLEEVEAVSNGTREALEVEPQVEGRVGNIFDDEAHLAETTDDEVTLVLWRCQIDKALESESKDINLHGSAAGGVPSQCGRDWAPASGRQPPGKRVKHLHQGSYRKSRCYTHHVSELLPQV